MPKLNADTEQRFDEWFNQFTRPYEKYEKNREKLWEMLGLVGEKEAPMEMVARLEEIKRLRNMQWKFKKQFLAEELDRQNQEWIEFVEGLIDSIHQERHHFSDYYEDMNSLETMGEVADKLKDKLKKRGKEHHDE